MFHVTAIQQANIYMMSQQQTAPMPTNEGTRNLCRARDIKTEQSYLTFYQAQVHAKGTIHNCLVNRKMMFMCFSSPVLFSSIITSHRDVNFLLQKLQTM